MMFINSIFLPKNLSDQTLPEGVVNSIGNFSHLFANVFKIVKDGPESQIPIQLLANGENLSEDTQAELLKVSLFSNNNLSTDNSNISNLVSLFMSQITPAENVEELADINKIKVSEKTPKYFSLNKNDFVKEIKGIIESLKNTDSGKLENVEISLITNGQSILINPLKTSVDDLEKLISENLQTGNDFKILIANGKQKLTIDVEPINTDFRKTANPIEILTDNSSANKSNKILTDTGLDNSKSPIKNEIVETSQSALQPQLQGTKQGLISVETKKVSTINQNVKPIIPLTDSQIKIISNQQNPQSNKVFENQNTNAGKNETKVQVVETNNLNIKIEAASKNDSKEITIVKTKAATEETLELKTKEVNSSEKKITVKSNQKINSVSLNNNSVQEKIELQDLIEKTEVKEIKIDFKNFVKKNSEINIKYKEFKTDTIAFKANLGKQVNQTGNIETVKPAIEFNQENEITFNKNIIAKSRTTNSIEVNKPINQKQNNPELKNEYPQTIKDISKSVSNTKKELLVNRDSEKIDTKTVDKVDIKVNSEKSFILNKTFLNDIPNNVKSNLNVHDKNKIEVKDEIKNETSDWYKSKIAVDTKNPAKESVLKEVIQAEVKTDTNKIYKSKTFAENINSEDVVKAVDDKKSELIITPNKVSLGKTFVNEAETNSLDVIDKNKKVSETQNIAKPVSVVKENVKQVHNIDVNHEILKIENSDTESEVELVKTKDQKPFEFKTAIDLKESNPLKVDFKERRIYSQVPKLEVIAAETELKTAKIAGFNTESKVNEISQETNEPVKSELNQFETRPKTDKQVWVKVSVEKNENEVLNEFRKPVNQQSKITIDVNSDDMKKDFTPNSNSEKESQNNLKQKSQTVSVEAVQSNEQKPVIQNQSTTNQNETTASVKPEIKTEQNTFKSEFTNSEVKHTSRQAEMVERVKVISSGEMVREVYKVLENGEKQSIVLKLVPKELGAIKVMLDTVDNVLTAKVEVENESVGTVIRNNVEQLKHNLAQNGVHVNSINISYHNSDQKQHGFNNQKRKNPAYLENNELEDVDETIVTKKMGYNTYEFLA